MKIEMRSHNISFNVGKVHISFTIYTTLPELHGLSIEDAVNSWVYRTEEYTAESLVTYITNKDTGFIAITEEEYLEIMKKL